MEASLNKFLANVTVEYHKLQNLHWYVEGKDFFTVHAKLEELYDGLLPIVDEVAETILQLGGNPVASLEATLKLASIKERTDSFLNSSEAFGIVAQDFQTLLEDATALKKEADAQENYLVSAQVDTYIASFTKLLWMLRQQAR